MITLIAAIGKNREIGKDNQLLWDIPEEMKVFIEHTRNKTVLMGRKTFESIGKPLPNRKNIVISKSVSEIPGTTVYSSLDSALQHECTDVVVIGGEQIYRLALPLSDELILSHVNVEYPDADSYFPAYEDIFTKTELIKDHNRFITYKYIKR